MSQSKRGSMANLVTLIAGSVGLNVSPEWTEAIAIITTAILALMPILAGYRRKKDHHERASDAPKVPVR